MHSDPFDSFFPEADESRIPSLSGDFYQDADDVVRGVTLFGSSDPFSGFDIEDDLGFKPPLDASLQDATTRGCSDPLDSDELIADPEDWPLIKEGRYRFEISQYKLLLEKARADADSAKMVAEKAKKETKLALEKSAVAEAECCKLQEERTQLTEALQYWQSHAEALEEATHTQQASVTTSEVIGEAPVTQTTRLQDPMLVAPVRAASSSSFETAWGVRYLYASSLYIRKKCGSVVPLPPLQPEKEILGLEMALPDSVTLEVDVASVVSLRKAFNESCFGLHLSLHTVKGPDGGWFFLEDPRRACASPFSSADLQKLLEAGGLTTIPFVVLSSCDSAEMANVFVNAGVRNVVCCTTEVRESDARRFSQYFYHALSRGRSFRESFAIAIATACSTGDPTGYHLMSQEDVRLASAATAVLLPRQLSLLAHKQALPSRVEDFAGRQQTIDSVLLALQQRSFVVLYSTEPKAGLTATLLEIAHYVAMPGRRYARRCSFFPNRADGGLLVVDNAYDIMSAGVLPELQSHLAAGGAILVGREGMLNPSPFAHQKAVHVLLPRGGAAPGSSSSESPGLAASSGPSSQPTASGSPLHRRRAPALTSASTLSVGGTQTSGSASSIFASRKTPSLASLGRQPSSELCFNGGDLAQTGEVVRGKSLLTRICLDLHVPEPSCCAPAWDFAQLDAADDSKFHESSPRTPLSDFEWDHGAADPTSISSGLTAAEAARLFTQRVQRPLRLLDFVLPADGDDFEDRVLSSHDEVIKFLIPLVCVFGGAPDEICRAAAKVTVDCPALRGDMVSLMASSDSILPTHTTARHSQVDVDDDVEDQLQRGQVGHAGQVRVNEESHPLEQLAQAAAAVETHVVHADALQAQ